jgi:hypothetical protein
MTAVLEAKRRRSKITMDVLVDLDGTLVDPKPGLIRSVQYALDRLGFPVLPAEELLWLIGPPFRVSFPKLLGTPDLTEQAIAHYRECYFSGGMYEAMVYEGVPPPSRTTTPAPSSSVSISRIISPASTAPNSTAPTTTRPT